MAAHRERHITVVVSNDLSFDQRVEKTCASLRSRGYAVTRVGRLLKDSVPIRSDDRIVRFKLRVERGALFYAAFNLRLLWYLLFTRTDIIWANDLDTLLPAFLVAKWRNKKLVYDSHEYFTEAEGLTGRPFQKGVWLRIEKWIFPRLKHVITVNESIATIYQEKYRVPVLVVRNMPRKVNDSPAQTSSFDWPEGKWRLILQGAYIDPDRGGMEAAMAMAMLPEAHLLIVGSGRDLEAIKNKVKEMGLQSSISFLPRQTPSALRAITASAQLGLSLDKPIHLNYTFSLPNKVFDYIHAGIPILASNLPELRKLLTIHHIGMLVNEVTPESIAGAVRRYFTTPDDQLNYADALAKAAKQLHWDAEADSALNTLGL